ncbi:SEC-C domain-containing protein [Alkaliphilus sp. B6464]|nr:SEC-C domain-containing protein [Alkaliphilus sp. B6464]
MLLCLGMCKVKRRCIVIKIGRNEPCPCGSGKKYKKCCLNKTEEQRLADAIMYSMKSIKNDARIKKCLHPKQEECDQKIIKAHAIQNNRILNKLGENGLVITMDGTSNMIFQGSQKKGRKIATTFTGFCKHHDKLLFQEIEDSEFIASQKQIFLFTYRTMAWHYHKKQEQLNAQTIRYKRMYEQGYDMSSSEDFRLFEKGLKLGIKDNENEKLIFDELLLDEIYDKVNYCIWELPYEVEFAVSMMHELEHDILGQAINNLETDVNLRKLYLNIFPADSKSFCIWSWLKENDDAYIDFSKQFMKLNINDRENYFNNNLPRWTDSIIISPRLWNRWGDGIQEALITHANFDILYRVMEEETSDYKYSYMDTPWNFFEKTI